MMRVGILGTGDVARALARGFSDLGHEVWLGSRTAEKGAAVAAEVGGGVGGGTFAECAARGELLVLATLGSATVAVAEAVGVEHFAGKVVWDTTNPLDFTGGFPPVLATGAHGSNGEAVQGALPGAHVVKVFNTVGNALMFRPDLEGGPPDMFLCGEHDGAKELTATLLHDFGWGAVDAGGIRSSRYLEGMCIVWVIHGARSGSWGHAYKLLGR